MVARKIKEYLESHGIRQTFVADKIGVDRSVFNLILNGKRKLGADMLVDICGAIGVDINTFSNKDA